MTKIKTFWMAIVALLYCSAVKAHDFEVDGIYYNITSGPYLTIEVTYKGDSYDSYSNEYTGEIVIPESVTYNNIIYPVKSIGDNAFRDCSTLTTITIPNSVKDIGENAFYYCKGLENVILPKGLTSIRYRTFYNCIKLSCIDIPEGVTELCTDAFWGCNALKEVNLPNSLKTIEKWAFGYCNILESITIPENVTSMAAPSFYYCPKLSTVISHAKNLPLEYLGISHFNNISSNATLYYPAGCDYNTWERYFSNMIPIAEEISINISSTNNWSTCVIPFVTELPEGMRAFTSTGIEKDKLLLEEVVSLNSYTPYILYAENGFIGSLTGKMDVANYQETVTDGLLCGAISEQQIGSGYVLQNQGGGSMFHNVNGKTFTIPAGKCWLDEILPGVATVRVSFGGTTNIEGTETEESKREDTIYDLSGRPVDNPQKGKIYIINGKKVLKL